MLLACYSHKHISYRIRTIIRKAINSFSVYDKGAGGVCQASFFVSIVMTVMACARNLLIYSRFFVTVHSYAKKPKAS
ncbi:MAG: hypothetical protein ACRC6C_05535 [Wolbachia pipientis]